MNRLQELAQVRATLATIRQAQIEAQILLEQTPQFVHVKELAAALKQFSAQETSAYDETKKYFTEQFDGVNKKPTAGIEFKEFTPTILTDPDAALKFALDHTKEFPNLVQLNTNNYLKMAAVQPLPGTKTEKEYRCQIAQKLDFLLEKKDAS